MLKGDVRKPFCASFAGRSSHIPRVYAMPSQAATYMSRLERELRPARQPQDSFLPCPGLEGDLALQVLHDHDTLAESSPFVLESCCFKRCLINLWITSILPGRLRLPGLTILISAGLVFQHRCGPIGMRGIYTMQWSNMNQGQHSTLLPNGTLTHLKRETLTR